MEKFAPPLKRIRPRNYSTPLFLARRQSTFLAVLSNATRVDRSSVRAALLRLDRPILKLDAGNDSVFRAFNRPLPGVDYEEVIRGLGEMREISLQALFAGGPEGNTASEHIDQWIEKLKRIRPQDVQVYSLSRPVPSRSITPAPPSLLDDIRNRLVREGIPTERF